MLNSPSPWEGGGGILKETNLGVVFFIKAISFWVNILALRPKSALSTSKLASLSYGIPPNRE